MLRCFSCIGQAACDLQQPAQQTCEVSQLNRTEQARIIVAVFAVATQNESEAWLSPRQRLWFQSVVTGARPRPQGILSCNKCGLK